MAGPVRPQPGRGLENRARWREPAGEETVGELDDAGTPRVRVCRGGAAKRRRTAASDAPPCAAPADARVAPESATPRRRKEGPVLSEADRVRGARIARRYAARSPSAALCTSSVDKSLILQRTCTRPHADVSQVDWLRMECYRQDRGASRLSASLSPSPLCSETPLEILNKIDRDAATAELSDTSTMEILSKIDTDAAAAAAATAVAAHALRTPQRPPRAVAAPPTSARASAAAQWRRIPRARGAAAWLRGAHNALLVTGASDGTINFWHSGTGLCVGIFKLSKRAISAMTWFIVPSGGGGAEADAGAGDVLPGLDAGWKVRSSEQLTLETMGRLRLVTGNAKGTVKVWRVDAKVWGARGGARGEPSLEIDLKFCSRLPQFTKGISHIAAMLPMRVGAADVEARRVVAVVEESGTLIKLWAVQRPKRDPKRNPKQGAGAAAGGGGIGRAAPCAAGAVAASDARVPAAAALTRSKTWPPPSATSSFSATKGEFFYVPLHFTRILLTIGLALPNIFDDISHLSSSAHRARRKAWAA